MAHHSILESFIPLLLPPHFPVTTHRLSALKLMNLACAGTTLVGFSTLYGPTSGGATAAAAVASSVVADPLAAAVEAAVSSALGDSSVSILSVCVCVGGGRTGVRERGGSCRGSGLVHLGGLVSVHLVYRGRGERGRAIFAGQGEQHNAQAVGVANPSGSQCCAMVIGCILFVPPTSPTPDPLALARSLALCAPPPHLIPWPP